MSLRDFLLVLRSRWKMIVASLLLVVAATTAVVLTMTPVYTAHARFFLAAKDTGNDPEKDQGTYVVTTADLNTYVAVLGSPPVMDPLREKLGLAPGTPIDVTADVSGDTSILNVTARSEDPVLAAEIANAVGPQLAEVAGQFSVLLKTTGQEIAATTISPAEVPTDPTSPDVRRALMLALLAGLCIGVGVAFVRHALDTRVRSDADIAAVSTSPILASLPVETSSGRGLSVEDDPARSLLGGSATVADEPAVRGRHHRDTFVRGHLGRAGRRQDADSSESCAGHG